MRKLGIAVTTFNRRKLVINHLDALARLTSHPFDIIVCDDGSSDGTREVLASVGYKVLGGINKGIAWNKNRGMFYLFNVCQSDVVLLLDDDVFPIRYGWEQEWIEAVERNGHVNYLSQAHDATLIGGDLTASSLGIGPVVSGQCLAMTREAHMFVGYMDSRFGRYGHEHTELTNRFVRAGFGGFSSIVESQQRTLYYLLRGGLAVADAVTSGTQDEVEQNTRIFVDVSRESIYRAPWRTDIEMAEFRAEVYPNVINKLVTPVPNSSRFCREKYLRDNPDVAVTGIDPLVHYLRFGMSEGRPVSWECKLQNDMSRAPALEISIPDGTAQHLSPYERDPTKTPH